VPQAQVPTPFVVARHRRAELLAAIHSLERALATPAGEPSWLERVDARVEVLRRAFGDHVTATEGAEGMYADILRSAPRLKFGLDRLVGEHADATASLDALAKVVADAAAARGTGPTDPAAIDRVRDDATDLLGRLLRHRQRGADLVFEAYEQDIGGCD
jgi:hypothetical protein